MLPFAFFDAVSTRLRALRVLWGVPARVHRVAEDDLRFVRGFEDAAIGMALTSADGRWVRVNDALCDLLGRPRDAIVGRTVAEFMHPDERPDVARKRASASPGRSLPAFPRRMVRGDGTVVETLCSAAYVDEDGDDPYFFSQIQDVTEHNRAMRHSAALVELGRLAVAESDTGALLDRALPIAAAAIGARACTVGPRTGPDPAAAGALCVPLGRADDRVLSADRDAPADELDHRFLEAAAAVLGGALARAGAEAETRRRALHDPLTGLANRTFLTAHLEQQLAGAAREPGRIVLLLLDGDRFKMVNDTLGHGVGDELLREVADRLRANTREGDLVARLGGDEFVVACRGVDGPDEAAAFAGRIVAAFEAPFALGGRELVLGASVGVALATADGGGADALLRDADVAMYRAKEQGGGSHVVFDAALRAGMLHRLTLEVALRAALDRGELCLHFQPVVDLRTDRLQAFEALLRWEHPEHGRIPPVDFIPIAEDTGVIVEIGEWVIDEAVRQIGAWNAARAGDPLRIAINLSARQLTAQLVPSVRRALERHGVPAEHVVIEITESLLVEGDVAVDVLAGLRRLGVGIALDDFGTGYSSLGYISEYALDIVKLDRSLIARIATSPRARGLVHGIVGMADALGLIVLAEGLEDREQATAARDLGCRFGQGWLYAAALEPDAASELALGRTALPV